MSAHTKAVISDYSVGVNAQDVFVLPPYFPRNYLSIQNVGPSSCAVSFNGSAAATNANGSFMLPANSVPIVFEREVPQSAIHARSAGTSILVVQSDDVIPGGTPFWILNPGNPPAVDLDFLNQRYFQGSVLSSPPITVSRASTGTDLLPASSSGATINTFANNVARITLTKGLLVEESRTNNLLNSNAPVTQTTASLGTGTYTLWVNGSGSATSSAGTAVGAGFGAATNGTPNVFTVSVAGTVVVTVAGSLNAFQLELGGFGTSFIVTAAATATRAADSVSLTNTPSLGQAITIYGQGTTLSITSGGGLLALSDGTTNNRMQIHQENPLSTGLLVTSGSNVSKLQGAAWSSNVSGKEIFSVSATNQSFCFNGGTVATSTAAWSGPALYSQTQIGNVPDNFRWDGYVERIAIWPTTNLPDSTIKSLST